MQHRIETIDLLRGFALLGLPTMNIVAFSMPFSAYINPTSFAQEGLLNHFIFSFFHLFSDQKFMGLFSLLFGASIILLASKTQKSGNNAGSIHYSRMLWLFLLGLLHAFYLWEGDVLMIYALLGVLLYPLKNLRAKWLFILTILGLSLSALFSIVDLTMPIMSYEEKEAINSIYQPSITQIQQDIRLYQSDYETIQKVLVSDFIDNRLLDSYMISGLLRSFSMMCLGMALFKIGLLSGKLSEHFYRRLLGLSLLISLPLISAGLLYNYIMQWQLESFTRFGSIANIIGSVPLVIAYIALFSLFQKSEKLIDLKSAIQNVGKMALTNYLMQSIICAFVFYGYGLGLYGQLSRLQLLPLILLIWGLQLFFSTWWLGFFKQGPIEWCWRMLTYFRWHSPLN
jgi:uncharacterized protein